MTVAHFPEDPPPRWHQPVVALGNFDGLHRGHTKIIDRVRRRAGERARDACRDDARPASAARPASRQGAAAADDDARRSSRRWGAPACRALRWCGSRASSRCGIPRPSCAPCWSSGCTSPRSGSAPISCSGTSGPGPSRVLRSLGARYGFRAEKIDPVRYKDFVVSSTRIRRLVQEGRVDEAGALLGHHYFIDGTVARGAGRGRDDRVSDRQSRHRERAAAAAPASTRPRSRSTASCCPRSPTSACGRRSATSIGSWSKRTCSTSTRDLYGQTLRLSFVQRLRDERTFPDVDALRAQIEADCRSARRLFVRISL